jgi:hypothetical protein
VTEVTSTAKAIAINNLFVLVRFIANSLLSNSMEKNSNDYAMVRLL